MRVVIIADREFANAEHLLLSRLELGLADEGVRTVHAVPEACAEEVGTGLFSQTVRYSDEVVLTRWPSRAAKLRETITDALNEPVSADVDLVHAFGPRSWRLGWELARQAHADLVIEADSWRNLPRIRQFIAGAAAADRRVRITCTGATEPIARRMELTSPGTLCVPMRWGVPPAEHTDPPWTPDRPLAVTVFSRGAPAAAIIPALEALAALARRIETVLIFADASTMRRRAVWSAARRLGLLPLLSVVGDVEARREPVLRTHVLMAPDMQGRCTTLMLSAMAAGLVVVTPPDPALDFLLRERTALLVDGQTTAAWSAALGVLTTNPERCAVLADTARQYIARHQTLSQYVAGMRGLYDRLLTDAPTKISSSTAASELAP